MILVKIYWNTEADGTPVAEHTDLEDGPISYVGPFDSIVDAVYWMENTYPDDDTDVYEMVADEFEFGVHEPVHVNTPYSLFSDIPDEDIRDDSREIHGS